jgi:ATP-dependent Clp protease ATP-binding subunit ClpB
VAKRLADKKISMEISPAALERLAKEGYDPHYGARPLKRVIQTRILNPVAEFIIENKLREGAHIQVDVKGEEFSINILKKSRVRPSGVTREGSLV